MSRLNPAQDAAVNHHLGPALVVAGAGSGKTRVLTNRIVQLIEAGHAFPGEILALTFTNKAAKEMRERVRTQLSTLGPEIADQVTLATFHSAAVRWLRRYASYLGISSQFSILDDQDQNSVVKEALRDIGLSDEELAPKYVLEQLDRLKNEGIDPTGHAFLEIRYPAHRENLKKVVRLYEDKKQMSSALDFGDLLLKLYQLLENHAEVAADLSSRYPFILVDEYQDTNAIQYKMLKKLASHHNLFVVGDEDQSIYRWRGADIRNIREFEKDFPNAVIYKLEENYRSTQNILDVANHVISHNIQRREKNLFTQAGEGELVETHAFGTDFEEAKWTGRKIKTLLSEGSSPKEIAILYRSHSLSRLFEDRLRLEHVPYMIYGGHKFYERAEIKDALAYLRLLVNPRDDIAFYRIINVPARGIGAQSIEKLRTFSKQEGVCGFEALSLISSQQTDFSPALQKKFQVFLKIFDDLQRELRDNRLSDFYAYLLDRTGYKKYYSDENSIEAASKLENLQELRNVLVDYETQNPEGGLADFLQESSLATDFDRANPAECVQMMTLHSAKGLEFAHVFIVGLEEGVFPSKMSLGFVSGEDDVDEERRLCYVGVTRAQKHLYLTYSKVRRVFGRLQIERASRFIGEMPSAKIAFTDHSEEEVGQTRRWQPYDSSDERSYFSAGSEPAYEDVHIDYADGYKVGAAVEHPEFGRGVIKARSGLGDGIKVQVEFRGFGTRKFLTKFAKLRVLDSGA